MGIIFLYFIKNKCSCILKICSVLKTRDPLLPVDCGMAKSRELFKCAHYSTIYTLAELLKCSMVINLLADRRHGWFTWSMVCYGWSMDGEEYGNYGECLRARNFYVNQKSHSLIGFDWVRYRTFRGFSLNRPKNPNWLCLTDNWPTLGSLRTFSRIAV